MRALLLALLVLGCSRRAEVATADPGKPDAARAPRVIADKQDQPWGVFVDDQHVWWSNKSGGIMRRAKEGGAAERIAAGGTPYAIAPFGRRVFFSDASPTSGGIGQALVGSGASDTTTSIGAAKLNDTWAMVAANGRLYWTQLRERTVASAPLRDSDPGVAAPALDLTAVVVHAKTTGRPVAVAVDATHVYWTDSDPGVVARAAISGGAVETLVSGGDKTTGLAIDDARVYWSEWGSGRIASVAKNGGPMTTLATEQQGARAIAIDANRVYWTHPPSGSIRSVAKAGGAILTHATHQQHPYSVAVDATTIYWANVSGDTVMAIEK